MKLSDKIKIAFKDLINRKLRTVLTVIAISIGSLLLIIMMGIGDGVVNQVKDMVNSFGDTNLIQVMPIDVDKVGNVDVSGEVTISTGDKKDDVQLNEQKDEQDYTKKITDEDAANLENIDGVEKIKAEITGNATSIKLSDKDYVDKNISIIGVSFKYNYDYSEKLIAGKNLEDEDNDILVSETFIKKLGVSDNDELLGKEVTIKAEYPKMEGVEVKAPKEVTGKVVGILPRKDYRDTVIMSEKKANSIAGYFENKDDYFSTNGYSQVGVFVKEGTKVADISTKINNEYKYQTFYLTMLNSIFDAIGTVIKSILSIAGIIVLIVAALGLVNTVGMILQEKRKMIGVMRSVGGSKHNIRMIFLFQSIMLGIFGGAVGALLSSAGIVFVNEVVTKGSSFKIALTTNNVVISFVITVIISLIAGLIPASRAAKLNVVEAVAEE